MHKEWFKQVFCLLLWVDGTKTVDELLKGIIEVNIDGL